MKILCTICARSGSKNLPKKNFKKLKGKPLICYTIEQAIKSKLYHKIVLSSDDPKIFNIGKKYNIDVWFLRPKNLSGDKIAKISVIRHSLNKAEKSMQPSPGTVNTPALTESRKLIFLE